jgi:hypothetical protein
MTDLHFGLIVLPIENQPPETLLTRIFPDDFDRLR